MPKLNDTQTILLSTASRRESLSLHPLPKAHAKGRARITKALATLVSAGLAEERETSDPDQIARSEGDLSYGLYATPAALAAIGVEPESAPGEAIEPAATVAVAAPARTSKTATILALLRREQGATLSELIAATGWLPHTTRAALTGLRKKGHVLDKVKRDGATCYRIAGAR